MGSDSAWPTMESAAWAFDTFGVCWEPHALAAHRTPHRMLGWAEGAAGRGLRVVVAGAGEATYPPDMIAADTSLPIIGVPRAMGQLDGMDCLLPTVQMPAWVPVASMSIGGGRNAGLLPVRILAASAYDLRAQVEQLQVDLAEYVVARDAQLQQRLSSPAE